MIRERTRLTKMCYCKKCKCERWHNLYETEICFYTKRRILSKIILGFMGILTVNSILIDYIGFRFGTKEMTTALISGLGLILIGKSILKKRLDYKLIEEYECIKCGNSFRRL